MKRSRPLHALLGFGLAAVTVGCRELDRAQACNAIAAELNRSLGVPSELTNPTDFKKKADELEQLAQALTWPLPGYQERQTRLRSLANELATLSHELRALGRQSKPERSNRPPRARVQASLDRLQIEMQGWIAGCDPR